LRYEKDTDEGDLQMEMLLRFTASIVLALIMGTACDGQHYARINLVSTAGRTAQVYCTPGSSHGSGGLIGCLVAVPMEHDVEQGSPESMKSTTEIHAHIKSTPAGADILVDGTYVGTTPLAIDLTCCFHDVTISKPGLKPWTGRVRNNGHANIRVKLRK
jgi:PEGA domain